MVNNIQYTTIRRVLEDLSDHPILKKTTLEQAVRYNILFLSKHGYPEFFQDKMAEVDIHNFRGVLPCDLIAVNQVRDAKTKVCLRSMTDSFNEGEFLHRKPCSPQKPSAPKAGEPLPPPSYDEQYAHEVDKLMESSYGPRPDYNLPYAGDLSFKTQGRVIYTSYPEGKVELSYRAIPVDEDGFPAVIDNEIYIDALVAFIKMRVFGTKFDTGNIDQRVYRNAKEEYAAASCSLETEFGTPSVSEVESFTRMYQSLIPRIREFSAGFKHLGNREYLRVH